VSGRNIRVSGENLIAAVPLVRILNRISIHVPAIAVPVAVDRPEHWHILMQEAVNNHRPLNILRVESYSGLKSPPASCTNSYIFSRNNFRALMQGLPGATLEKNFLKLCRKSLGRCVPHNFI